MRILIAGGTGFVGSRLVALARECGHTVTVTSRTRSGDGLLQWDARSPLELPPVDAVINLVGESVVSGRWTKRRKQAIRDSRVESTAQLVAAMRASAPRPQVFVCSSAVGYYGNRGDEELDEKSTAGAGFLAEVCKEWEGAAIAAESLGIRVARVRTGVVLARGGGALGKMLLPFKLGLGGKLGTGLQWMPWIHREDLVRLMLFIVESSSVSGVFNGTAPEPARNCDFTRTLGRVLGRPTFAAVPGFVLRTLLGEMSCLLLEGQRALPRMALASSFQFAYPHLEAALQDVLQAKS